MLKTTHTKGKRPQPQGHATIALQVITTHYDEIGVFAGAEKTIGEGIDNMLAAHWENGEKLGTLTVDLSTVRLD